MILKILVILFWMPLHSCNFFKKNFQTHINKNDQNEIKMTDIIDKNMIDNLKNSVIELENCEIYWNDFVSKKSPDIQSLINETSFALECLVKIPSALNISVYILNEGNSCYISYHDEKFFLHVNYVHFQLILINVRQADVVLHVKKIIEKLHYDTFLLKCLLFVLPRICRENPFFKLIISMPSGALKWLKEQNILFCNGEILLIYSGFIQKKRFDFRFNRIDREVARYAIICLEYNCFIESEKIYWDDFEEGIVNIKILFAKIAGYWWTRDYWKQIKIVSKIEESPNNNIQMQNAYRNYLKIKENQQNLTEDENLPEIEKKFENKSAKQNSIQHLSLTSKKVCQNGDGTNKTI